MFVPGKSLGEDYSVNVLCPGNKCFDPNAPGGLIEVSFFPVIPEQLCFAAIFIDQQKEDTSVSEL